METVSPSRRPIGDAVADDRAARLAALAQRRLPAPPAPLDPLMNDARRRDLAGIDRPVPPMPTDADGTLHARLAALADRRTAAPPGSGERAGSPGAGRRAKRRHAAKGARAAALGLSLASTGALATLFGFTNGASSTQVQAASIVSGQVSAGSTSAAAAPGTTVTLTVPDAASAASTASTGAVTTTPATTPITTPATAAAQTAAETVVQGAVFHNKWGDVQVQATFAADGSLVDVTALQTPDADGKSVRINDRAVPLLNTEALSIQSAQVDTVSGATYTSNDYRRSLQSAIDVAREAGLTAIA